MVTKEEKKKESCESNEELLSVRMPNLPDVIIVEEILSRLPVKSLIRFRSVCKSWNSLIASDPHFATLQFNNYIKNKFLDHRRVLLFNGSSAFLLDKKASTNNNNTFTVEKLNFPEKGCSSIVASCDGLVCIKNNNTNNNVLLFWNSLTGETKTVLEEPPTNISSLYSQGALCTSEYVNYGLGYDSSSDDYKLVRIYYSRYGLAGTSVICKEDSVYSLRTNSWRLIEGFPKNLSSNEPGVFVNGALYWVVLSGYSPDSWKVVSFDLAKEKCRLLDIPDEPSFPWTCKRVGVLGETLYVCYESMSEDHKLWLIDEYEDVESWAKYTITTPGCPWILTPLFLLKNGEEDQDQFLLAVSEGKLGLYNLRHGTFIRYLQVPGMPEKFQTVTFLETLFSPNTFNGINN